MYRTEYEANVGGFRSVNALHRQAYERGKASVSVGTVLVLVTAAATVAAFVVSLMH